MKLGKTVGILTGFILLAGCAATGPVYKDAPKPPAVDAQSSVLYMFRTGPFLFGTNVLINDKLLLSIPRNSYTWFSLEPGIHHFEINASMGAPAVHFEENIEAGREYYMHLSVSGMRVAAGFVKKGGAMRKIETLTYAKPVSTAQIKAKSE